MRCANCGAELGWVMGPTLCGVCQKAQLAAQEAARRLNERVEAILVDPVAPMQDRRPLTRLEQQHEAALKVTRLTRELNEATREALELGVDVYVGARNRAGDVGPMVAWLQYGGLVCETRIVLASTEQD